MQTIRKQHLLEKGMHIVVGLSGGPDSLCMFDVLCNLAPEWDLKLHPVHVNHKFRPGAAEEDQDFVEKFCEAAGWPCRTFVCDCTAIARQENLTPEEAGRKVRYDAFRQTAEDIAAGKLWRGIAPCEAAGRLHPDNAAGQMTASPQQPPVPREKIAIAVAQNAQDQCETILFRLLRGSGPDGLAGIAYKRYDEGGFAVIRPLLDVIREEIEAYCTERGLMPRRDHTNEETVYMRNRIRLELIPYLQEHFNPNIIETVNRLGRAAAADKDYLTHQADVALSGGQADVVLSGGQADVVFSGGQADVVLTDHPAGQATELQVETLRQLHPAIRMRVYQKAAKEAGLKEGLTAAHLDGIDQIVHGDSPSARWELPDGFTVRRIYDRLTMEKEEAALPKGRLRIFTEPAPTIEQNVPAEPTFEQDVRLTGAQDVPPAGGFDSGGCDSGGFEAGGRPLQARFSLDALKAVYGEDAPGKIILRSRKTGDFMTIATGGGLHRKKLQDLLVDMKVPKAERDRLQVAAIGSEILWILPGEKEKTGNLGKKGRFSAGYRTDSAGFGGQEAIIVLEYLC
ncbi:MAG: tRNA lysidine(34) synthetase TilS [Anaerovoracaceae bacterium]